MANLKTQQVVGDLGSQEHAQLVASYNALLDVVGDLVTALKSATDSNVSTPATTAETAMEAGVKKLQQGPEVPLAPAMATTG